MADISILGVDVSSTRTAAVHWQGADGSLPAKQSGAPDVQFIGTGKADHADRGARLLWYVEQYNNLFATKYSVLARANITVIEGYAFGARASQAHSAGEVGCIVRLAALRHGWRVILASPAAVKLATTGKGNAAKEVMLREVFRQWSFEAKDNNDADAYALMRIAYLYAMTGLPGVATTKLEKQVLSKLEVWGIAAR